MRPLHSLVVLGSWLLLGSCQEERREQDKGGGFLRLNEAVRDKQQLSFQPKRAAANNEPRRPVTITNDDAGGLSLQLVAPPKAITLNDRKTKIKVAYQGVVGQMDIHVDLKAGDAWYGGGMVTVKDPIGMALVDLEVRVPYNYEGELTLGAYLSKVGENNPAVKSPVVTGLKLDPTPVDAIGVLCQPTAVQMGSTFNLNLWYTQTHARPNKLIAVALNAQTKEYYGGCSYQIEEQQGELSCAFQLKRGDINLPLKFKAWIGGPAPDYDSYTMISMKPAYQTENACPGIGATGRSPANLPPANWIDLKPLGQNIPRGQQLAVDVEYNLVTEATGDIHLSLMTWNWDTHGSDTIATAVVPAVKGLNRKTIQLAIPADAKSGKDGEYVMVYMAAKGEGYALSLAEDRNYEVSLGGRTTFNTRVDALPNNNNQDGGWRGRWQGGGGSGDNGGQQREDGGRGQQQEQAEAEVGPAGGFGWFRPFRRWVNGG